MYKNLNPPIILTKLYIPEPRIEIVFRKRLLAKLDCGLDKKLTLISAPVGFGKSTLLSSWIKATKKHVGWLSLDTDDNDPVRFFTYFISLVQGIDETIGQNMAGLLQSAQSFSYQNVLSSLINEISESSSNFILILDDYHEISSEEVHEGISFFLEYQPRNVHLIISTREDPPIAMARLRALGEINEIRASDLRFKSPELEEFLNQKEKLDLSQKEIETLDIRTEGWAAGLQLAAVLLDGQADKSAMIQSFTGSNRLVMDYLLEEVLDRQPKDIQSFLLQTSILNRMTGSLCDAITGKNNGQKVLESLNRANFFLIPLDNQGKWYRYHHLFADFLETKQFIGNQQEIKELHLKASNWHREHKNIDLAYKHALESEDIHTAANIIELYCMEMIKQSNLSRLHNWLIKLPESEIQIHPWICIAGSWERLLSGKLEESNKLLQFAVKIAQDKNLPEIERINGHIFTLKAYLARWRDGDIKRSIVLSNEAKKHVPTNSIIARSALFLNMGNSYLLDGKLSSAISPLRKAISIAEYGNNTYVALAAYYTLGIVQMKLGNLRDAETTFRKSIHKGTYWGEGKAIPTSAYGYIGLGQILYEKNDLEAARESLEKGIELAELINEVSVILDGTFSMIQLFLALGNIEKAKRQLNRVESILVHSTRKQVLSQLASLRARVWIAEGNRHSIQHWIKEHGALLEEDFDYIRMPEYLMIARLMMENDKLVSAKDLLLDLQRNAEAHSWTADLISIHTLLSLAEKTNYNENSVNESLLQTLKFAQEEGFVRTLVDNGDHLNRLLKNLKTDDTELKAYIHHLHVVYSSDTKRSNTEKQPLIEPISDREMELLVLIAQGHTNNQIAEQLFLSPNTVKSHLRNIYQKLGVNSRTKAIADARSLNILPLV